MTTSRFQEYLSSHRRFFSGKQIGVGAGQTVMFIDCASVDGVALDGMLRIAMALAQIKRLRPIVMTTRFGTAKEKAIIQCHVGCRIVTTFGIMLSGLLRNPIGTLQCFRRLRTGAVLSRLLVGKQSIGRHIYDLMLRRHGLPELGLLTPKQRLEILAELAFYFGLEHLFARRKISFALLGDNTYRQGIAFEMLKLRGIPSVCAININGLAAHLYLDRADYALHCRTPDPVLVDRFRHDDHARQAVEKALISRTSGTEIQHDLIRAYDPRKRIIEGNELRRQYGVTADKKLILVMSHIFQDAPHAYPGALFRDYKTWLLETCRELRKNPHIVFVVKEHPSIELYGEHGTIDRILAELGPEQVHLVKNINTRSFFDCTDVVVTCGGTCGLEFPCFGVPIVVAARPPYSGYHHIRTSRSQADYFTTLEHVHKIEKLSAEAVHLARTVFFTMQEALQVDKAELGLSRLNFSLGGESQEERLWQELASEGLDDRKFGQLVRYCERLLATGYRNFVDLDVLEENGAQTPQSHFTLRATTSAGPSL